MATQPALDSATLHLVRFAAVVARGEEPGLRESASACRVAQVPIPWVEEMLLQSLLMTGYPRTLIAFAIWRKVGHVAAPPSDPEGDYGAVAEWTRRGEANCGVIYGANYGRLRENVQELHPALDAWMITEGYGRTMGRPGLDLLRREFCTIAQTAVLDTPRQLHSHLRGALHAGGAFAQVDAVLGVVNSMLSYDAWKQIKELWASVRDGWEAGGR
jgi:4-carboxymuconolactone decarboxylase